MWGLAVHPWKPQFLTCGYDRQVSLWDSSTHQLIWNKSVEVWLVNTAPQGSVMGNTQCPTNETLLQVDQELLTVVIPAELEKHYRFYMWNKNVFLHFAVLQPKLHQQEVLILLSLNIIHSCFLFLTGYCPISWLPPIWSCGCYRNPNWQVQTKNMHYL